MTFRKLPFIATANSLYDYNMDNSAGCVSEILKTFCVKALNPSSSEPNNVGTNFQLPLCITLCKNLWGFEANIDAIFGATVRIYIAAIVHGFFVWLAVGFVYCLG
jgi:hypothetical protein